MSTWPSQTAAKTHLDETTDDPSQARAELAAAIDLLNQAINARAQALGVCDLDAAGLVPSARLTGSVDSAAIQTDAVQSAEIKAGEVNFLHWNATLTSDPTPPTGGVDGDIHLIYEV